MPSKSITCFFAEVVYFLYKHSSVFLLVARATRRPADRSDRPGTWMAGGNDIDLARGHFSLLWYDLVSWERSCTGEAELIMVHPTLLHLSKRKIKS